MADTQQHIIQPLIGTELGKQLTPKIREALDKYCGHAAAASAIQDEVAIQARESQAQEGLQLDGSEGLADAIRIVELVAQIELAYTLLANINQQKYADDLCIALIKRVLG